MPQFLFDQETTPITELAIAFHQCGVQAESAFSNPRRSVSIDPEKSL